MMIGLALWPSLRTRGCTSFLVRVVAAALMGVLMTVIMTSLKLIRGAAMRPVCLTSGARWLAEGCGTEQCKADCDEGEAECIALHRSSWIFFVL